MINMNMGGRPPEAFSEEESEKVNKFILELEKRGTKRSKGFRLVSEMKVGHLGLEYEVTAYNFNEKDSVYRIYRDAVSGEIAFVRVYYV